MNRIPLKSQRHNAWKRRLASWRLFGFFLRASNKLPFVRCWQCQRLFSKSSRRRHVQENHMVPTTHSDQRCGRMFHISEASGGKMWYSKPKAWLACPPIREGSWPSSRNPLFQLLSTEKESKGGTLDCFEGTPLEFNMAQNRKAVFQPSFFTELC